MLHAATKARAATAATHSRPATAQHHPIAASTHTGILFFFTIFQDFSLCISIFTVKLFIVDDFWQKIFSIFSPKFDIKKLHSFKLGTMTPHRFFSAQV
jgi:hypothetical protein